MRIRDHNKADLALAALTLSVAAVAAGSEAVRWAAGRVRRHRQVSGLRSSPSGADDGGCATSSCVATPTTTGTS